MLVDSKRAAKKMEAEEKRDELTSEMGDFVSVFDGAAFCRKGHLKAHDQGKKNNKKKKLPKLEEIALFSRCLLGYCSLEGADAAGERGEEEAGARLPGGGSEQDLLDREGEEDEQINYVALALY